MSKKHRIINSIKSQRTSRSLRALLDLNEGTTIPVAGTAGYEPGSIFNLTNAVLGQSLNWINQGTATSCLFVPTGPTLGYGILAAGARGGTNTSATEIISGEGFANTDIGMVGHILSNDTDTILSAAMTADEGEFLITASADPTTTHAYLWAAMRNKCIPAWDIIYAGSQVCAAAATTAITQAGVLSTDIAIAFYQASDDTDTIVDTICTANTVTVTHSTTSSALHTIGYMVLRPRGTFKPSHYIAYAGIHTTLGGAAAEAITVTGALATDIAIVVYETTNDTDTLAKAVVTVDTLTVTCSTNPSTTHALSYMLLRAY